MLVTWIGSDELATKIAKHDVGSMVMLFPVPLLQQTLNQKLTSVSYLSPVPTESLVPGSSLISKNQ